MVTTRLFRASAWLLLGLLLCANLLLGPHPATGLSLNPTDYYDVDFHIVFSETEVEPQEQFSISAGATVLCTKDLPIGMDEASVSFAVTARQLESGNELTLLDNYDFTVSDVPDWAGDEYSTEETVLLSFPSDAASGRYAVTAEIQKVSLDGWNVTAMIPASYRTIEAGTIACIIPDVAPPPPTPQPGRLTISILGHEFRPAIDPDGFLLQEIDENLIEDQLSLHIDEGTRCLDDSGSPLSYISATRDSSPAPYQGGIVLSAFILGPHGADLSPAIRVGIAYDKAELPEGCEEDDLVAAYYDKVEGRWQELPGSLDRDHQEVSFNTTHFSSFGLLAPTAEPLSTRATVTGLDLSPEEVARYDRVNVSVTVGNGGDSDDVYPLVVKVNGTEEHSLDVAVVAGASQTLRFTVVRTQPGEYEVSAGALNHSFTVLDTPPPAEAPTTSTPTAEPDDASENGLHPVYTVLLVLAGIGFLTLVVLILAKVL